MWVEELDLSTADREKLLDSSQMLNDKHIQAAHDLLRNQFPQLGGLQGNILFWSVFVYLRLCVTQPFRFTTMGITTG